jgi:hypothetical protein
MSTEKRYIIREDKGIRYVLTDNYLTADFMGTGMALAGVLRRGETIEAWQQRIAEYRIKAEAECKHIAAKVDYETSRQIGGKKRKR